MIDFEVRAGNNADHWTGGADSTANPNLLPQLRIDFVR
jgi:hypothetical protein